MNKNDRWRKVAKWSGILLLLSFLMPVSPFGIQAFADSGVPPKMEQPGTDLWRAVRERDATLDAVTQVQGAQTARFMNPQGEEWRQVRSNLVIPYSAYFLLGSVAVLVLLALVIRREKIPGGRSGRTVTRMTTMQRISHWLMAGLVLFMAATGLVLLFGRSALIPWLGHDAFGPLASASKEGHNLIGPLLIVAVLLMLVYYLRHNWPAKGDLKWLFTLGGRLSGDEHQEVGFFNAGEKILFWLTTLISLVLIATGLILLFPNFAETVDLTQLAVVVHAAAALLLLVLALGHIWMVRTVEGTLEAITTGEVDENWAKSHHSRWYQSVAHTAKPADKVSGGEETAESDRGVVRT